MTDTAFAQYVATGSEKAFGELTNQYIHLVYGTAVRLMNGDRHGAEDVTQVVFIDLARLAGTLSPNVMLGGWLHRRTCHVAATLIRSQRRREIREREAMNALRNSEEPRSEQLAAALDAAINQLNTTDRSAILLRYFEGHNLRTVGQVMGTNEDAAQKRVTRALEKLRAQLVRRGLTVSAGMLATTLSAQSAVLAPSALATSVASAALASATAGSSWTLTLLKLATMNKLKITAGTVAVASLGSFVALETTSLNTLRAENQVLRERASLLTPTDSSRQEQQPTPPSQPTVNQGSDQVQELERLRGEIAARSELTAQLTQLRAQNASLRAAITARQHGDAALTEFRKETIRRISSLKRWGLMFRVYQNEHQGQWPESWEQVAESIPEAERESFLQFARDHFEITYHGDGKDVDDRPGGILFREKEARRGPDGKLVKAYGHFDGSASTRSEPPEGFEAWEKQFIISSK